MVRTLAAAVIFIMVAAASCHACKITMGWDVLPPYMEGDYSDSPVGFDIEVAAAVMKKAGCDLGFVKGAWGSLVENVLNGTIDMISDAGKEDRRLEAAWFSDIQRFSELSLFVRKGETDKMPLTKAADLVALDIRIGTVSGYFYGAELSKVLKNKELFALITPSVSTRINIRKLAAKRLDAFIEDRATGIELINDMGYQGRIEAHPLRVASEPVYYMFSRKRISKEQAETISEALEDFKQSEDYQEILKRHNIFLH